MKINVIKGMFRSLSIVDIPYSFKAAVYILLSSISFSQWSTSTKAESALFVCPGFSPNLMTFDDGSVIFSGAGDDNVWLNKFDQYGHKLWNSPANIISNDSANNTSSPELISDGNGGCYSLWTDERGMLTQENYGFYIQRIDKFGNVKFQTGGIPLALPNSGIKIRDFVADGVGGFLVAKYIPDYFSKQAIVISRYDSMGTRLWETMIDTLSNAINIDVIGRVKNKTLIYSTKTGYRLIDDDGNILLTPNHLKSGGEFAFEKDTAGFIWEYLYKIKDTTGGSIYKYKITRFGSDWESLWENEYDELNEKGSYTFIQSPLVPDGFGGVFTVGSYEDTLDQLKSMFNRITKDGRKLGLKGIILNRGLTFWTFSQKGEIGIYFSNGYAQKYDTNGNQIWQNDVVVISNTLDSYFERVKSDNNGGAIVQFWTTLGGLYAQHTGRTGNVGILTSVQYASALPLNFILHQNFPNPFNSKTKIVYELNRESNVMLTIYDITGREIKSVVNEKQHVGKYTVDVEFKGSSSGIYFYQFKSNNQFITKKMIYLK